MGLILACGVSSVYIVRSGESLTFSRSSWPRRQVSPVRHLSHVPRIYRPTSNCWRCVSWVAPPPPRAPASRSLDARGSGAVVCRECGWIQIDVYCVTCVLQCRDVDVTVTVDFRRVFAAVRGTNASATYPWYSRLTRWCQRLAPPGGFSTVQTEGGVCITDVRSWSVPLSIC